MVTLSLVKIDNREPTELVLAFEEHPDVDRVSYTQLDSGDVQVVHKEDSDPVAFERKTPEDFVTSMQNGRLEAQIATMYERFGPERSYLVIDGDMEDFVSMPHTSVTTSSVRGFVGSLSARWQCVPLFCSGILGLTDTVTRIARKLEEQPNHRRTPETVAPSAGDRDYLYRAVLSFEGVGPKLAERITDEVSALPELATMAADDLIQIEGVGEARAESICRQMRCAGGNE